MNWNLKDHGDIIEKLSYNLTSSKLPLYKEFWSKYVGNFNGKPAKIKDISDDLDVLRKKTAQYNYTILRNIVILEKLKKRNENKKLNRQTIIESESDYLTATHIFFNTVELIYALNLLINKGNKGEDGELVKLYNKYSDFVSFRNFITHNLRPTLKIISHQYHVPKNFEWFSSQSLGKDTWVWDEYNFEGLKYQKLSSFIEDRFYESISILNSILKIEIEKFDILFKDSILDDTLPVFPIDYNSQLNAGASGFVLSGT